MASLSDGGFSLAPSNAVKVKVRLHFLSLVLVILLYIDYTKFLDIIQGHICIVISFWFKGICVTVVFKFVFMSCEVRQLLVYKGFEMGP